MKADVAIIGSGPGGALAAYELADSGLDVVVIEKQRLPRAKPCGGLMPGFVRTLTDCPLDTLIDHRVDQIDFFYKFEQPFSSRLDRAELLLTDRASFDMGILEFALKKSRSSLKVIDGVTVTRMTEHPDHISIRIGSETITTRAVIAADGASSKAANQLGLPPPGTHGAAIDAEIEVSARFYEQVSNRLIFNYFYLPVGYGWIFPKGNGVLSCGVGSWGAAQLPLKKILSAYVSDSIPRVEIRSMVSRGHPIPIFSGKRSIATRRACLVGDAASLVNPVSGEGIRYALISGKIAAETVKEVLLDQDAATPHIRDCREYQARVYDAIGGALDAVSRYQALPFNHAPEFFYRKFIRQGWGKGGW